MSKREYDLVAAVNKALEPEKHGVNGLESAGDFVTYMASVLEKALKAYEESENQDADPTFQARVFEALTHGYPAPFAVVSKLSRRIAAIHHYNT